MVLVVCNCALSTHAMGMSRWSRTQLLGEIARGHWGLCKASTAELTATPAERRGGLDGRLAFAPDTEMTEDFIKNAAMQMNAVHDGPAAQAARENHPDGDADD